MYAPWVAKIMHIVIENLKTKEIMQTKIISEADLSGKGIIWLLVREGSYGFTSAHAVAYENGVIMDSDLEERALMPYKQWQNRRPKCMPFKVIPYLAD